MSLNSEFLNSEILESQIGCTVSFTGCASNVETQHQSGKLPPQDVRPKIDSKHTTSPKMVMDSRPMEEYDIPWDQKNKRQQVSRSGKV